MDENLKPRGEKPQWWLAVRPSALAEAVAGAPGVASVEMFKAVGSGALAALDSYQERLLESRRRSMFTETAAVAQSLVLLCDLSDVARVFAHGAAKYAPGNFRNGFEDPDAMRREYFSAIIRHLLAAWTVRELDDESGLDHGAHALCGALVLLEMEMELVK